MTERSAVPPGPLQVNEKLLLGALNGPVLAVPLVGFVPAQLVFAGAALAVQLVALVELQVSVEAAPFDSVSGLATRETVGADGAVTFTVTDREISPPAPAQVSAKVLFVVSGAVDCEPDVALVPDHAPDAVQVAAFVEDHVRVATDPLATIVGLALKVSVGAGGVAAFTFTVTDCVTVPPVPVHEIVKVLVAVRGPVDCEPDKAFAPDHAPDAVHVAAFVDVQVNVEAPPLGTVVGSARTESVGTGGGVELTTATVTDSVVVPPAPVHVSENALVACKGPVDCAPEGGRAPDHAPLAVQDEAFVDDQASVAEPPLSTLAGLALSETLGATGNAGVTSIITDRDSVPPLPEQANVKRLFSSNGPIDSDPVVGRGPDHAPEAVHEVALFDDHRRTALAPRLTTEGSASSETTGAAVSPPQAASPATRNTKAVGKARRRSALAIVLPGNTTAALTHARGGVTRRRRRKYEIIASRDYRVRPSASRSRHSASPSDARRAGLTSIPVHRVANVPA